MLYSIQKDALVEIIETLADDVIARKDQLTELDAVIGDGDLGVTMTLGFNAVKTALQDTSGADLQQVLRNAGMAFAENAASTFGTLIATMFLRAGNAVKGQEAIGPVELAAMLRAAAEGVQKRGKANVGDKTVLDALVPAAETAEQSAAAGKNLPETVDAALTAARQGSDHTLTMRARAGRSSYFGDRTIGVRDPGAAALVIMLESVSRSVNQISG